MNRDEFYLRHILDAAEKIASYTAVGHDEFMTTSHWQDAVIRQLEIIGEAAKQLSEGTRSRAADVPWRRVCGLRDVLIHNYMGVDLEAVWEIAHTNVPVLRLQVARLLQEPQQG